MKAGAILASLALLAPAETPIAACAAEEPGKLPIQLALRHYIKRTEPKPMRFLTAAGTDSSLSEMAEKVLQEFGPTYYYAGSEASRQKIREKLENVGPFPALLVVRRAAPKAASGTEIIRLGGHFVTGEQDGKHAKSMQYTYVCGASGWTLKEDRNEGAS